MNIKVPKVERITGISVVFLVCVSVFFEFRPAGTHFPVLIETLINFLLALINSIILALHSKRILAGHRRFAFVVFLLITVILGVQFANNLAFVISTAGTRFSEMPLLVFGPLYWILFLTILVFAENVLVNGRVLQKAQFSLRLLAGNEKRLQASNEEIQRTQTEMMQTLAEVLENRSEDTAFHVIRVAEYSRVLGEGLGLDKSMRGLLFEAAPLHDIGKTAIPDSILNKCGVLTEEEMNLMKTHTVIGYSILLKSRRPLFRMAATIAYEHHERWDGSGYPLGKTGDEISQAGQIVAMADIFDALTTKRCYKDAWSFARSADYIRDESGNIFNPALVAVFVERIDEFRLIMEKYRDPA